MILQNPEFLLLVPLLLLSLKLIPRGESYTRKISALRTAVILLLVFAAASPTITQIEEATTEQKLNILIDNTTSTQVLEKQVPVEGRETVFASGNNSRIFSQAASSLERNSYNILVTDAHTEEKVSNFVKNAQRKNATVSVYAPNTRDETGVTVEGPSSTVPGAANSFTVETSSTAGKIPVNVTVDGESVFSGELNESYSFTRSFESGTHTVQAEIQTDDVFSRNNQYSKTVEVQEKPKILTLGTPGTLEENLEKFYEVENQGILPEDLDQYHSIVMKKPAENGRLRNYIAEGNGLVYTGPMENPPDYLPVERFQSEEDEAGARVIILIDISASTAGCQSESDGVCYDIEGKGQVSKESIRIAYSLVDGLGKSNEVGVVAYSDDSYLVAEPQSLSFSRESIKTKISRISPDGPSYHDLGLRGAASMAEENDTVVMLSDGRIGSYSRSSIGFKTRSEANAMDGRLITVGMGEDPNKPLLEDIAESTDGGYYLENSETGRLKFRFGAGGGESEYTPVAVVNPNHFITEGVDLDGSTTGFKPVRPKDSARLLASGSNGEEFLTSWRYGLGRVAAFSAGGENLDRTVESDPEIVSRTVSWSVGDPKRKRDQWVEVEDSRVPESPEARASYSIGNLSQEGNVYSLELEKPGIGLHSWRNETYAYNYRSELENVGVNRDKVQRIAQETNGTVFTPENIREASREVREIDRQVERRVSLSPYLLSLALFIFLAEVGYRKRSGRL
jgi:hypothetical protein